MVSPRVSAPRLVSMLGTATPGTASYAWLTDAIRLLITDGRLLHETRLPSERDLVGALGLSRTTVSRAYAELRDRGYVTAQHGSGTRVQVPGGPVPGGAEPMLLDDVTEPGEDVIDLRSAAPSGRPGLAAAYEAAVPRLGAYTSGMGYFPLGVPELREAVADRFAARGVPTSPGQIIITTGSLAALAAVERAVLRRGDRVVLESPTYPGGLASLQHTGARLVPVPAVSGSTDVEAIADRVGVLSPRAMLLLPDFHNPTGTLMPDAVRARVAHIWKSRGVVGIVDETVTEIWLEDRPDVRPMAAHAPTAVTVGGVSKSHWGGLRIGWIRAPHDLVGAIGRARATLDLGAPVLEQLVVADLLRQRPTLDDETRLALRARRDQVIHDVRAALPGWEVTPPSGGLSLWWRLPLARSSALAAGAERSGVLLAPGSAFAVEGHGLEQWIRTPFALDASALERAVPLIAQVWEQVGGR
ncbi:PLP-dependent aminotransferase family protein [Luteipulveratus mongoliensis]|uniref:HTH gntR-type domain-containing protein n=1 Tax=Luteipulveratus mongoliensis TaxID=571913 RepID=A0A0K1JKD8_9MICO|nr:PLP-dependent aminotransferase family protein [Luteipulveratus mongoliensis]AKU17053.1 hypothetical protein VV02_16250 [Luteipulveratus mongoliensis]